MIGLDTSILIRFLTHDHPVQSALAEKLISTCSRANPGFVAREVMIEVIWVLDRAYKYPRAEIANVIEKMLEAEELLIEASEEVGLALQRHVQEGYGLADMLIAEIARRAGCQTLYSFDRKATQHPDITMLS